METKASDVKKDDLVIDTRGDQIKVIASYKDGYGPSAVWCIEGYAEGRPTSRIRGNPDTLVEVVGRA